MKRQVRNSRRSHKPIASKLPEIEESRSATTPVLHDLDHDEVYLETSSTDDDGEGKEDIGPMQRDEDSELDIDEPRIAQWEVDDEDEDDDEYMSDNEQAGDREEGSSKPTQTSSNDAFSVLSYGSLLKARRVLSQARVGNASDDSDSETDAAEPEGHANDGIRSDQMSSQDKLYPKRPDKRAHKHAPIEMTSKRPVTRRRQVVDVKKVNYRDPRFSASASDGLQQSFYKHYAFLEDMHKAELDTLKGNLKRARNMLRSSPIDQREAWAKEVDRLERAYKRTESTVNRDRKEAVERQALEQAHMEEKERRKSGKGDWHMKKAERKELLLKASHDALAQTGGRTAVRKAIEKRQKKVSQKEKRQLPSFAGRGQTGGSGPSAKRRKVAV